MINFRCLICRYLNLGCVYSQGREISIPGRHSISAQGFFSAIAEGSHNILMELNREKLGEVGSFAGDVLSLYAKGTQRQVQGEADVKEQTKAVPGDTHRSTTKGKAQSKSRVV